MRERSGGRRREDKGEGGRKEGGRGKEKRRLRKEQRKGETEGKAERCRQSRRACRDGGMMTLKDRGKKIMR